AAGVPGRDRLLVAEAAHERVLGLADGVARGDRVLRQLGRQGRRQPLELRRDLGVGVGLGLLVGLALGLAVGDGGGVLGVVLGLLGGGGLLLGGRTGLLGLAAREREGGQAQRRDQAGAHARRCHRSATGRNRALACACTGAGACAVTWDIARGC